MKEGQLARLYDILLLGPIIIWYTYNSKLNIQNEKIRLYLHSFLLTTGITVMTFNGYNFIGNALDLQLPKTDLVHIITFIIIFVLINAKFNKE